MAVAKKRHKSFTPKNRKSPEPLTFDLYDQTFTAYPELQGMVILDFAAAMAPGGDEDESGNDAGLISAIFDEVLEPESLERFKKLTRDPKTIVPAELLAEIVGWLMEEYTGRDLAESSPSSDNS